MELVLPLPAWIALLFDKSSEAPLRKVVELEQIDDLDPGEVICCSACNHRITTESARISVAGSHSHQFTNPSGIEYRIGCFSAVWNCSAVGAPTAEHSWFPGFAWRIGCCTWCGQHLGWSFSRAGEQFHGLILARLVAGASGAT